MSIKPLGSEKLQGMDKINRILEISRYKETIPTPVNENHSSEYKITLSDGNEYQIVKEKVGYIIKKTISESDTDYIEPMKNRKYYSSYSQAFKRLNLMAKEINTLFENKNGVSLFSEQKKFVLKTPEKKNPEPAPSPDIENVPPPPPPSGDMGGGMTPPPPMGGDVSPAPAGGEDMGGDMPPPPPPGEDMGEDMPPAPEGGEDMGGEDQEGGVTFKTIQKLTGKLGQKLRQLGSDEENEMSSKDVKYVINSILSALNLNSLEDEDKEEILSKFDGEDMEDEEDMGGGEDMGGEESPEEMPAETSPEGQEEMPEGEMTEEARFSDMVGAAVTNGVANKMLNSPLGSSNKGEMTEDDMINSFAEGMFTEQKVENILSRYFLVNESEKKFNKKIAQTRKVVRKEMNSEVIKHVNRLSETVQQEIAARKFLKGKSQVKFLGRTNKKNLVFEVENKQYKISPKGQII